MSLKSIGFVAMAALLWPAGMPAAQEVVWRIGKQDHASLEFQNRWDFLRGPNPVFTVGASKAETDWSAFQPGPTDATAGGKPHPFTIRFTLREPPRGTYELVVYAMFKEPRIPGYFVDVNGKKGRFSFHPKLTYEIGDPDTAWNAIFSAERLAIRLPAEYFRSGANQIILSCAGDASETLVARPGEGGGSGIFYDAVELLRDPATRFVPRPMEAVALPTIFYRPLGGRLTEKIVLEASADFPLGGKAHAKLVLSGQTYSCGLPSNDDFGTSACAVDVPEFSGAEQATLTVTAASGERSFPVKLQPGKKWKVFLLPHFHLDFGYTDFRPDASETDARNVDDIIDSLEHDPSYRFNLDGAWYFENYFDNRGPSRQERLVRLFRERRLSLPAQYLIPNTGLTSQEALFQLFSYGTGLHQKYSVPLEYANLTDVPAHSWAVPSILSSAGIRYLAIASNQWRGPIIIHGRLNERSPFYWEGPDGARVLTWFSRTYTQIGTVFGHARDPRYGTTRPKPTVASGADGLPIFLQAYSRPSYIPDAVMVWGALSDNEVFEPVEPALVSEWNREFAYPKLTVATMTEFFHYLEGRYRSSFPTLRGDGGAWWEEMCAADAAYGARARNAQERVVAAETASSLGTIVNDDFAPPLGELRDIWRNLLLYDEHSWGGAIAWRHPESELVRVSREAKRSFTDRAELGVDNVLRRGLSQLADKIFEGGDTVLVFNSLSWKRSGLVEVELPRGKGLVDQTTGRPVALELLRRVPEEDYDLVRFWANALPPVGYRAYRISGESNAVLPQELSAQQAKLENRFYRITLDLARGGIASIYDKQLGRELVDARSPYALGQYLYVSADHAGSSLIEQRTRFNSSLLQYSIALPRPDLSVLPAGSGTVVSARKAPWGLALTMRSSAPHTPRIETEALLPDGEKRTLLAIRLQKDALRAPEAVYIAFPFAAARPVFRYEIQNAWVDPTRDQLPGANKEWFSVQHWVSVADSSGDAVGLAPRDAPLVTFGDINRGRWPAEWKAPNGTVFSYVMNNYDGDDERPFQGGQYQFRYGIASDSRFDPAALTRFGREQATPLEVTVVTGHDKRLDRPEPLRQAESGFLTISASDVLLSTWKPAEDGRGHILRFHNATNRAVDAGIGLPRLQFEHAYLCSGIEENREEIFPAQGLLKLSFKPHEIQSLRITGLRLQTH